MASPEPLRSPVRIFIQTCPAQLQKILPSLDQADTELIKKLCTRLFGSCDIAEIRRLITKTSSRKGSEQVEIVFDYGIPPNNCQPKVAAFEVEVDRLNPTITQLFHPGISLEVNKRVELWKAMNSKCHTSFPSRTDVRRGRRSLEEISRTEAFTGVGLSGKY